MKSRLRILRYPLVALVLIGVLGINSVLAAPDSPFNGAAPSFEDPAPETTTLNVGDWGVADQRGAATYTFPIEVPRGRSKMQPALALRYSSLSPLRGTLAAGWTLELPEIRLDRSYGREDDLFYSATLHHAAGRLVQVADSSPYSESTAFRIEADGHFTRLFKLDSGGWIALSSDGVRHFFDQITGASDGYSIWRITRQEDSSGNRIVYFWSEVEAPDGSGRVIDFSLDRIEYSANPSAGLAAHARIDFLYAPLDLCGAGQTPIGAALTSTGYASGARRLTSIEVSVRDDNISPRPIWRLSRRISLGYDLENGGIGPGQGELGEGAEPQGPIACDQGEAPLRYLTEIQTEAFDRSGVVTNLPPLSFDYNRRAPGLLAPRTVPVPDFAYYGNELGAAGTLLDVDGDGIRDLVGVVEIGGVCTLQWQRGQLGGGYDGQLHSSPLPTAAWLNGAQPDVNEYCNVNGQVAKRFREVIHQGQSTLIEEKGLVSYHFMDYDGDGRLDLLTNVWAGFDHGSYAPSQPGLLASRVEPAQEPDPIEPPPAPLPLTPEKDPGAISAYVWRVYRSTFNPAIDHSDPTAIFAEMPMVVRSPLINENRAFPPSLPPSASDEKLDRNQLPLSSIPTLVDMDGDGFQDFVDVGVEPHLLGSGSGEWMVYPGHGGDRFGPAISWPVPQVDLALDGRGISEVGSSPNVLHHITVAALYDVSGDGLLDLVVQEDDDRLKAYLNYGSGFAPTPTDLGLSTPIEESLTSVDNPDAPFVVNGQRAYLRRLADADGDGLVDMLHFPVVADPTQNEPLVHYNLGAHFLAAQSLPGAWNDARRHFSATDGDWHLLSDYTDGDGDGIADLLNWSILNPEMEIQGTGYGSGPRLLRSVENGRGQRIDIRYAPSTDPAVVQLNPSDPLSHQPRAGWVVSEVAVSPGPEAPSIVQRYQYEDPAYLSDPDSQRPISPARLRGFRLTTMTTVHSDGVPARRSVTRYAYNDEDNHPEGRVISEGTYHQVGSVFELHTVVETDWTKETLFGGKVDFYYPVQTLTHFCLPGEVGLSCVTPYVHRRSETWSPRTPSQADPGSVAGDPPPAELYVRTVVQEGSGLSLGADDRRVVREYQIRYGPVDGLGDEYRVLLSEERTEGAFDSADGIQFAERARKRYQYDAAGLPIRSEEWLDGTTVAVTERSFDPLTGNLLSVTRPEHVGGGPSKSFTYGPHQIFPRTTINELGHQTRTVYDVATGALLEKVGPNQALDSSGQPVDKRQTWTIDGLGREVAYGVSVDDVALGYRLETIRRTSYFDFESPGRVRTESLMEFGGSRWSIQDRYFDGTGRILSETVHLEDGNAATTTHVYDSASNRSAVHVPDPRVDDGSSVVYQSTYDGLNRLVRFIQPDGNGVEMEYSGLDRIVREVTSDGSGGVRLERKDLFGRMVEVHEFDDAGVAAVTRYTYDTLDNLSRVIDAEGNETKLVHDWIGNRVQIERGRRIWRYEYDLHGNQISERSPAPAGADPSVYEVRYAYDELDRLESMTFAEPILNPPPPSPALTEPAPSVPTGSEQLFLPLAAGGSAAQTVQSSSLPMHFVTLDYIYDQGSNGLGRLSRVRLPFGEVQYEYDARGLVSTEERSFQLSGSPPADAQRVERSYDAQGRLLHSRWDNGEEWRRSYDLRGLVSQVEWLDPSSGEWTVVADYERSLAGAPRLRGNDFKQERRYTYDALGRPVQDVITSPLDQEQPISSRSFTYSDSGDLNRVTGSTAGLVADATYRYDGQHRILTADGPRGYEGEFSYSPVGNVGSARVDWSGNQSPRDVIYAYGELDPHAVDRLIDRKSGADHAGFEYDENGVMTRRSEAGGVLDLVWDGQERIRQVEGPDGSEIYYYDHEGMRMLAVGAQEGVRFWFGERESRYDLEGKPSGGYLHLSDGSTVARVSDGDRIEIQYADVMQNLMLSLDRDGNAVAAFLYGPFGEVLTSIGEADHRRQFNGKENDRVSGLRYYGFRFYDPLTLRWSSADPLYRFVPEVGLVEPQRLNLYAFSLNNPNRYYDPDGRNPLQLIELFWKLDSLKSGLEEMESVNDGINDGRAGRSFNPDNDSITALVVYYGAFDHVKAYRMAEAVRIQKLFAQLRRDRQERILNDIPIQRRKLSHAMKHAESSLQELKEEKEGIWQAYELAEDSEEEQLELLEDIEDVNREITEVESIIEYLKAADVGLARLEYKLKRLTNGQ